MIEIWTESEAYQLSELIREVIEANDWMVEVVKQNYWSYEVQLSKYSPAGELYVFRVWSTKNNNESLVGAIRSQAICFDPDEHAASRVPNRGKNGIPEHILDIINDAMAIQDMIFELADALERRLKEANNG